MYSKEITINIEKADDIVHWENLSDIHIGNENFQEYSHRQRELSRGYV